MFAILNAQKELKFIGFTKDMNTALRRMLLRKPSEACYFAESDMAPSLWEDQTSLLNLRRGLLRELNIDQLTYFSEEIGWTQMPKIDIHLLASRVATINEILSNNGLSQRNRLLLQWNAKTKELDVVSQDGDGNMFDRYFQHPGIVGKMMIVGVTFLA
jgi:hypothetical protein